MAAGVGTTAAPAGTAAPSRFRGDIEGLRAVAVGLVLWYHAGLPWVSGGFAGVDVFFVISGFLITSQLVREVERSGSVSLPQFYARRAKRLFPAAFTVLAATAVMVWLVFPRTTWRDFGGDIAASAAYLINWRLAERSVDYLAEDVGASPVQHFWSLAVEEQYYIIWPLLILALALLIRRYRLRTRPVLAVALTALILLPSLTWSIYLTQADPARSYFVTTTRLWELAIGALVAIAATVAPRIPRPAAIALGWGGLLLIAVGALTQSTSTPWPGSAAAVPTLGAAAVIVAGFAAGPSGPTRILGTRPMVWVGGLSYSLYLWHWPLVVAAKELRPDSTLAPVAAVLLAFLPSWFANRWIENPIRHAARFSTRARPALVLGLGLSLAGVAAGLAVAWSTPTVKTVDPATAQGAQALGNPPDATKVDPSPNGMTPDPLKAVEDIPDAYARECQVDQASTEVTVCDYGDPEGKHLVVVAGDSKVVQWLPALDEVAKTHGWRVQTMTKSACSLTAARSFQGQRPYTACDDWNENAVAMLTSSHRPDLVITSSGSSEAGAPGTDANKTRSGSVAGYTDLWTRLGEQGTSVVALSDTPRSPAERPVYECIAEEVEGYMTACAFPERPGAGSANLEKAASEVGTAAFLDLLPWQCPDGTCPPVIGNVVVQRQGSHITATWARTMTPYLDEQLTRAVRNLEPELLRRPQDVG